MIMQELVYGDRPARKESPSLEERLDTLDRAAAVLDEQLDRLAGKLAPVLLPTELQAAPGLVHQGEVSPLADRLGMLHSRLDALGERANALHARVDL